MTTAPAVQGYEPKALELIGFRARCELVKRFAAEKQVLKWGWALFPEKFNLPFCIPFHQYLVDNLYEPYTGTEAPRNCAKTAIACTLLPTWLALEDPNSFYHILNVQATDDKAMAVNRSIKEGFENNPVLRYVYGNRLTSRWTDQQFHVLGGPVFSATGAGRSIRGLQYNNLRPDYVVADDLYNEDDINNPESTQKKTEWFWSTLYPARAKSKRHCVHVQGTAINKYDILESLKKAKGWRCKTFRLVLDWDKGVLLWPELTTMDQVRQDRYNMGAVIHDREYQNERRDDAASIIKTSWIQDFDPAELVFDAHFQYITSVLGVDPSIGKDAESDATGIVSMMKCRFTDSKAEVFYIDDIREERISLDARVRLLQKMQDDRPLNRKYSKVYIEGVAGFKDFVAEVRRRTPLPVKEVDQVKDKITVLENKSHFFENKRVFISTRIKPDVRARFIEQLLNNYPAHDDMRDAALLAMDNDPHGWEWV